MTAKNNGGAAFPRSASFPPGAGVLSWNDEQDGMTLRDWFAGQALAGFLSNPTIGVTNPPKAANWAYAYADEMLEARDAS